MNQIATIEKTTCIELAPSIKMAAPTVPYIPALSGLQRQGDVCVVPGDVQMSKAETVGLEGVSVLSGEHNHVLLPKGNVRWLRFYNKAHEIGAFTVGWGSVAYLFHDDHHAPLAFGPGTYVCRRQRELAGLRNISRFVED